MNRGRRVIDFNMQEMFHFIHSLNTVEKKYGVWNENIAL